jgi:hypothetical protein
MPIFKPRQPGIDPKRIKKVLEQGGRKSGRPTTEPVSTKDVKDWRGEGKEVRVGLPRIPKTGIPG